MACASRPETLDQHVDCRSVGPLLALAHEFDMPALTLRIKRMLLGDGPEVRRCNNAHPALLLTHSLSATQDPAID